MSNARTDDNIKALEGLKSLSREDLEALALGLLIKQGASSHRILLRLASDPDGFAPAKELYAVATRTGGYKTQSTMVHRLKEVGYLEHVQGYRITELGRKALALARPMKKRL